MRTIILLQVFVLGLASTLVHADADAERETLARIIHELEVLEPLLAEAKAVADPDARIRFRSRHRRRPPRFIEKIRHDPLRLDSEPVPFLETAADRKIRGVPAGLSLSPRKEMRD